MVFAMWNFGRSLKFYYKDNFCPSFSMLNWIAESEKIHYVHSTEILLNTATIREVSLTEIDSNFTRHYSDKLQTRKQTFTTSKHAIEFTYSDFPCHFKVNKDKLALTNRRWMCKRRQNIDYYHFQYSTFTEFTRFSLLGLLFAVM